MATVWLKFKPYISFSLLKEKKCFSFDKYILWFDKRQSLNWKSEIAIGVRADKK